MTGSLISTFLDKEWLDYTTTHGYEGNSQKILLGYAFRKAWKSHRGVWTTLGQFVCKTLDGYNMHITETGWVWFQTITIKWVFMILLVEDLAFHSLKTNKTPQYLWGISTVKHNNRREACSLLTPLGWISRNRGLGIRPPDIQILDPFLCALE